MINTDKDYKGFFTAYLNLKDGSKIYFDSLTSQGIKPQGEPFAWYSSEAEAWHFYKLALARYKDKHVGDVHWRDLPEVQYRKIGKEDDYAIFSRVCIVPHDQVCEDDCMENYANAREAMYALHRKYLKERI